LHRHRHRISPNARPVWVCREKSVQLKPTVEFSVCTGSDVRDFKLFNSCHPLNDIQLLRLGVVSIIFATPVNIKVASGNIAGAMEAGRIFVFGMAQ
jgi:hypothetical protein